MSLITVVAGECAAPSGNIMKQW